MKKTADLIVDVVKRIRPTHKYAKEIVGMAWFLSYGFRKHGFKLDRSPAIVLMMGVSDMQKEGGKTLEVALSSFFTIQKHLDGKVNLVIGASSDIEFKVYIPPETEKEWFRQVHIALAFEGRIKAMIANPEMIKSFKRPLHNSHLVSRILEDPHPFVSNVLDRFPSIKKPVSISLAMEEGTSHFRHFNDVGIYMEVIFEFKGIILLNGRKIHISFDSKVSANISGLIRSSESKAQQYSQFIHNRMELVVELLDELDNPSHGFSADEKLEALDHFIPGIFQHIIFVPKDTPKEKLQRVGEKLRRSFRWRIARNEGEPLQLAKEHPLFDQFKESLLKHVDAHFGGEDFRLTNSLMSYKTIEDPG